RRGPIRARFFALEIGPPSLYSGLMHAGRGLQRKGLAGRLIMSSPHRTEQEATGKKPYAKPAFRHEKVFETRALSCGKLVGATQGPCHSKPTNS
ncbi:MAG: hypothetical protein WB787_08525, partial [Candidatus Acidiferrales bacterium]